MSTKTQQSRDEEPIAKEQADVLAEELEEEELPDEADQKELEMARQRDDEERAAEEKEEEEPEEIVALRAAFQRVQDKIDWHTQQIELKHEEVRKHEGQIEELKDILRSKFGGLLGEIGGRARKPQQQPQTSRARTSYGDGTSTGDLIAACLRKARKPVNTESLTEYLESNGNMTNPSVELSRMVKKGLVNRPSRGFYEWVGGDE
jgi:hypothetical protein